jgi:NADH-quinone oxidoreductase subunit L
MDLTALPNLLLIAWLLPLASFAVIAIGYSVPQFFGRRVPYAQQKFAAYIAIGAIVVGCVLSLCALFALWLPHHPLAGGHGEAAQAVDEEHAKHAETPAAGEHATEHNNPPPDYKTGTWYDLVEIGKLRLSIGYYIDTLTVAMFCVVTLIASCVHIYAFGYMHDELHEFTDHEVTLERGGHLHRPGRFHRFFQYLSLFSFSMLGICIAGNLAMVFVFWELVGICSYFLIGFYIERHSASTAANKAFIVNRVGDFGMLVGLMAIWSTLGTFSFGDIKNEDGTLREQGIFSRLHEEANEYKLAPADGMVAFEVRDEVGQAVRALGPNANEAAVSAAVAAQVNQARTGEGSRAGQWLLFVAGVGIFCGCMGKSAQFPLHVWLPDAMEGPTPVSALVHSATMVAAGVFLVGRCYPIFSPEALLVIAVIGCITLFLAATIAITAVDIKRVLAYSTVSQLGFMMLALGLGGWVAGLFHLITHAFFKSLLFLGSGSVIHAVHTNDMRQMGGLRHKMPITAYTMLIGCLAIAGVGIPFVIGFSGFHSKDLIVEQALNFSFRNQGSHWSAWLFTVVPLAGALMTSFYMFRLWYMTFAGKPRDHHRYDHAHESPPVMSRVLLFLAVFAVGVGWTLPNYAPGLLANLGVPGLLQQAQPVGTAGLKTGTLMPSLIVPDEHSSHEYVTPAGLSAILVALVGIAGATVVYLWELISAESLRRSLRVLYQLTWNKWWFDELYDFAFVRPTHRIGQFVAWVLDRGLIDGILHLHAFAARVLALLVAKVGDEGIIDNTVDTFAAKTWDVGLSLRAVQTGRLRQYVMFIVVGTIVLFAVASLWRFAVAGP